MLILGMNTKLGTAKRMALEERIDNIGKKPKQTRRKKKGDDDVDVSFYSL